MKKLLFLVVLFLCGIFFSTAQTGFRAGLSGGLPVGDAGDLATFALAVNAGYIFEIDTDFEVGPVAVYSHSFGDELNGVEVDDVQFLQAGARGQIFMSRQFSFGVEGGYAIGINDGNDGGFFIAPRAAIGVTSLIDVFFNGSFIFLDGQTWNVVSLGVEFKLGEDSKW